MSAGSLHAQLMVRFGTERHQQKKSEVRLFISLALLLRVGYKLSFQAVLSHSHSLQGLETAPYLPSSGWG